MRIVAALRPLGVPRRTALVVIWREPVGTPFPDIAGHVIEPESVGRVAFHRCRSQETVGQRVRFREAALPNVAAPLAPIVRFLIAPGILLSVEPAAGGSLPFGFCRQALPGPSCVGVG